MKKLVTLLLLFWFYSFIANAQQNWLMQAGSGGNDEALAISTDGQGNIITTGYFTQPCLFGTTSLTPAGAGDVFVAKQNAAGVYQWAIKAGGSGSDRGLAICTDAQGNTYITGFYSGTAQFGSFTLTSNSASQDVFVAKLDAAGTFVYAVSFGGSSIELPSGIAVDNQNNVVLTGQFKGTGVFGLNQFVSLIDPSTNLSSYDIFILKLDAAGALLWAKHGKAKKDDRGLQATTDASGNIYLTGQFTDTLKFTQTYPNVAYNVGYLLKLSPTGQELWFSRIQAALTAITGLVCKGDELFLTGDFLGQMTFAGPPSITLASTYPKKIFIAKYNTSGTPLWAQADGSYNGLYSRNIAVDGNGNAYITGNFKCTLSEYSAEYDIAVFNSVGFRDVFVTKYSNSGQKIWERQLGGTGDDYAAGIIVNTEDRPVICGSFEKFFNVPATPSFITYPQNANIASFGPNPFLNFCNDDDYGNFVSIKSAGNKDVLTMMPVDLSRQPYDYYDRGNGGPCVRDTLLPYLNQQQDTISACGMVRLYPTLRTGLDNAIGPEYEYLWSNGATNDTIEVTTTGQYILNYNFKDDCHTFSDTIYVEIFPNPPSVNITSTYGPILRTTPIFDCEDKLLVLEGDTAILTGNTPPQGLISYWTTPSGQTINNTTSIAAWQSGTYTYFITTPNGLCQKSGCVQVVLFSYGTGSNALPGSGGGFAFNPQLYFPGHLGDTIRLCPNDTFTVALFDSTLYAQGIPHTINLIGKWSDTGGISLNGYPLGSQYTLIIHQNNYVATQTGPASITVQLIPPPGNGGPLFTVTRNFYLDLYAEPVNNTVLNGVVSNLCPGDTAQVFVSGGANYIFSSGINNIAPDSSWFKTTEPGIYKVISSVADPITGCINRDTATIQISYKPAPDVTMNPASGLICPNDSVLLTAYPAVSYSWVGPLGDTISIAQTAYATSAGNYYYIMKDADGCSIVSSFVEVREYSTPYLSANPGNVICPGGTVTLQVEVDPDVGIVWQAPLSGTSAQQVIHQAGTYYVDVTFCDVTTTLSITIETSTIDAQITILGDSVLCTGQTVLLGATSGAYEYLWEPSGEEGPQFTVEDEGTIILQVTDENTCVDSDTITFTMLPAPQMPTSGIGDTVCVGDSALVFADGVGLMAWYLGNNTPYVELGNQYITNPIAGPGVVYAAILDTITGCHSLFLTVDVGVKPPPILPTVAIDSTICEGNELTAFISGLMPGSNFAWYGPGIVASTDNPLTVPNFDASTSGVYYLVVTGNDSIYCGVDTAAYNVQPVLLPIFNLPSDSLKTCEGEVFALSVDTLANYTYVWNGASGIIPGQEFSIPNFTTAQNGFYIITATHSTEGCAVSDSIYGVAITLPQFSLSTAPLLCEGDSVTISAEVTNLSPGASFMWYGPGLFEQMDSSIIIANASLDASGQYYLQILSNGCATDTVGITIVINHIDSIVLVGDTVYCAGGALQLSIPAVYAAYNWSNGTTTPQISIDSAGVYTITVTANNGCTATDSVNIEEVKCTFDNVGNVFTPNGDGVNDDFVLDVPGAESIHLEIYNRWGNLIRKLNGQPIKWNGTTMHGEVVTEGVYYYIGQAKLISQANIVVTGYVQVIR